MKQILGKYNILQDNYFQSESVEAILILKYHKLINLLSYRKDEKTSDSATDLLFTS